MTTRLHGDTRYCPLPGCERVVKAGHLMCGAHWRTVPKHIQRQVWATWRAWQRDPTDDAWASYMAARAAALGHVDV